MQDFILGLVQGLTEFLPVSSSGHLTIFSKFMEINTNLPYFAVLHLATFFAVLFFVFKEVWLILKGIFTLNKDYLNLAGKLIVSTIPAVFFGLMFNSKIEEAFSSIKLVGIFLAITALMMLFSDRLNKNQKTMNTITWMDALLIGLIQAFAIFPGVSRSGSTLFAALLLGMKKEEAVKYSFLMSLPVTFGAGILEMQKITLNTSQYFGVIAAFLSGLLGLYLVKKIVINGKLKYFAYYCFTMAAIAIIFM
ncbi:undecaprenyl-diphosphatase [Tepiditoga spiralis]|uniref:Undecaprenyl-diphosphatase n=1 Tax=Tepiditoga spiralis TaxID=2108365 RepID=A0A7G1G6S3_9BACT|nr:undecaprenyl-diphosphate phosphatase [Tepiditoga spiralis]BBE31056.1 undecaprenyl-diphosphatase [Tepiditoga spiralis]